MGASARPAHKCRARRHVLVFNEDSRLAGLSLYNGGRPDSPTRHRSNGGTPAALGRVPRLPSTMRAMALLGSKCSNWRVANAIGFPEEGGSPPPPKRCQPIRAGSVLAAHSRMGGRVPSSRTANIDTRAGAAAQVLVFHLGVAHDECEQGWVRQFGVQSPHPGYMLHGRPPVEGSHWHASHEELQSLSQYQSQLAEPRRRDARRRCPQLPPQFPSQAPSQPLSQLS